MTLLITNTSVYHEQQCGYRGSSSLSEISMQVLFAKLLQRLVFCYKYKIHQKINPPAFQLVLGGSGCS